VNELILGATMMGEAAIALFFLRFYVRSHDRLFAFFALAFAILSLNQLAFLFVPTDSETRSYLYYVRLLAFCTILAGILDKNRRVQGTARAHGSHVGG
jgi:hypothetical protein